MCPLEIAGIRVRPIEETTFKMTASADFTVALSFRTALGSQQNIFHIPTTFPHMLTHSITNTTLQSVIFDTIDEPLLKH